MTSGRRITPVHYTLLVRVFECDGWKVTRQKGDHLVMTKPGAKRPLVIKTSPRLVPITHIRTNMTTAGMSRERYFEILDLLD
ncbi:putative RNA binding protein YcfA (HicA-like mRNA interferase family) [Thermodesulfitimonas autotrophica]|uniref:Putative RNA binding protein YcfA (HicA-like mRNA interferase family) n=1 Tax=Thermodesulfitimonas autotrophica TaxID=1894989 RepID=A0A3N5AAM3_9THEO|nr:putative RNA binding protein YcfA (HicA-like mRNA interferase family) [Thermodesulfitimonas autotrophica]